MIAHQIWEGPYSYFRSGWRVLDAFIVALSIAYLCVHSGPLRVLRSLRVVRALRPLRLITRFPQLQLVVRAIIASVPASYDVFIVSFFIM